MGLGASRGFQALSRGQPPSFQTISIGGASINGKRREPDGKRVNINEHIRASEVRVISDDGTQMGVQSIGQALEAARSAGLDLVEVAPDAAPPVCRIMDFGRFKFQQSKKLAARKSSVVEIKEVKFRPKTDEHDYQFKLKHILKFLGDSNKIKVSLMFRGREIAHQHIGQQLMERVIKDVAEVGQPESMPKLEGRSIIMILAPKAS